MDFSLQRSVDTKGPTWPPCKTAGVPRDPIFKGDYSFNTGIVKTFSVLDYIILIAVLAVTCTIGLSIAWEHRQRKSIDDFLLAGRSLTGLPAGLSLVAGFISGITMVGLPGLVYTFSTMESWQAVAIPLGIATSIVLFMPVFHQLGLTSTYEYLEKRFSRGVRLLGSTYFIFMTLVYLSMVLYAPSVSVSAVTGVSLWGSIVLVGTLCIVYTALGGLRAVVYTDTFQVVVMIVGMLVIVLNANATLVSFSDMWESAKRTNRLMLDDFRLDPTEDQTVWSILIGVYLYGLTAFGVNQVHMHRCLCCRTKDEAARALWISIPLIVIILLLACLIGLYMAAFYENCDPKSAGLVSTQNELVVLFVMDTMSGVSGLAGIFMAALFSATLSTISSGLNSIAAVTLEDCFRLYFWTHIGEGRARLMIQVITAFFGVICLELTAFASKVQGGLFQIDLAINGALASPLLGVFILGLFVPYVNEKGALWGMLSGTFFNLSLFIAKKGIHLDDPVTALKCVSNCNITALPNSSLILLTHTIHAHSRAATETNFLLSTSSRLYGTFGVIVTIIVGLIVSKCTGWQDPLQVEPVLVVPICDVLFPFYYLPENFRKKLRCGIDHTDKWEKWYSKELELKSKDGAQDRTEDPIAQSTDIFGPQIMYARSQTFRVKRPSQMSGSRESEV